MANDNNKMLDFSVLNTLCIFPKKYENYCTSSAKCTLCTREDYVQKWNDYIVWCVAYVNVLNRIIFIYMFSKKKCTSIGRDQHLKNYIIRVIFIYLSVVLFLNEQNILFYFQKNENKLSYKKSTICVWMMHS